MFLISPVAETTISAAEKPHQTSLNTTGRLDKLPETRFLRKGWVFRRLRWT